MFVSAGGSTEQAHRAGKANGKAGGRETKGKVVTVVRGLAADANDLTSLLAKLKNACGAGGTLDGESLEIQGDHLERLRLLFSNLGYKVRG